MCTSARPAAGGNVTTCCFRDYLRARPEVHAQYGELKRELAAVWHDDRAGYTEAKSGFILDTLDDAGQWAVATGWHP